MVFVVREKLGMREQKKTNKTGGFTLLETMIAIAVLSIGLLSLAAMLADSMTYMKNAQSDFIAQQKAQEAMEAIFTAKYTNAITFAQIANTSATPPGVFLSTPQPILQPGADGLVGTSNDSTAPPAYLYFPGPDGLMGTSDDLQVALNGFTRTITITNVANDSNLRTINVTVTYNVGRVNRSYSMNSYISAFN
jgi:prepilin-type N-terminal cleavage/methylation domain-containing protein